MSDLSPCGEGKVPGREGDDHNFGPGSLWAAPVVWIKRPSRDRSLPVPASAIGNAADIAAQMDVDDRFCSYVLIGLSVFRAETGMEAKLGF